MLRKFLHPKTYIVVILALTFSAFTSNNDLRDIDVIDAENQLNGNYSPSSLSVQPSAPQLESDNTLGPQKVKTFTDSDTTTLATNPGPANNGGSPNWGMFLNIVGVGPNGVNVVQMSTANAGVAFASFNVEVFTRSGNALGGPVGSGPGSSTAGWTSLGIASATQGPVNSGVSEIFNIPTISVPAGDTVGVALVFTGVGPRYFGTGTPPYEVYTDANISITTGDVRSAPFTTGGSFFTSRAHVGVFRYVLSSPPSSPNFGSNGQVGDNLYYFANSLATGAPSFPIYDWRDTTGSTNLVLNGVATATINNGNLDDGRFDVIGQLPGTNAIRFFGVNYTDFYIGTNGFVAFYPLTNASSTWNIPASGLPNATVTNAYFAFWKDLNYGDVDVPVNRLSYKITSTEVIITFDRAPNFNTGTDANDYVSFQIIMEHAPAPATNTRMFTMFNFDQTGSSFITKYNGNTLAAHIIGLQNANAADKILSYRFRNAGGVIDPAGPIFGSNLAVAYGADQNALPVDLLSFTANVDGNNVTLNWTTAWEENNMKFDIQRRVAESDAQWATIGSVLGKGTYYGETNYSYYDNNLATGKYEYRLIQIDFDGNSTADFNLNQVVEVGVPTRFDLAQNYPNPFNPTTKIGFQIPVEGLVKLSVFDMSGREVATLVNESLTPGYYTYDFNASNLSSGAYFYRLSTANNVITKRMVLVK